MPRTLEGSHLVLAPLHQRIGGRCLDSLAKCYEGARSLAPMGVGLRDNRDLENGGVPGEDLLNLERRDVLPARDDDVLGTILDLDIAVWVHDAKVAGPEPAIAKRLSRRRRVLQIAL